MDEPRPQGESLKIHGDKLAGAFRREKPADAEREVTRMPRHPASRARGSMDTAAGRS
ncbi:hypothetical protein FHR83_008893 [Actinoplanes campanulatus]|uniref:Uncharacterized protein n=1 Tax=Actinoplanes campanulatus TaxID=113559 RepID=A0A7W5ARV4_9ACTN|nr:hypothetical protein [Actinoplanes campanulatus]MBB3101165.1 hypothetical protein [Actinoplanes campanulatus]GGN49941.1 hypothetical protein GCM10010109_88590 [Actinoplanes campanulatus]GID41912.1 hypothetical protein Aca09nite_84180 [Actinoplanes campanulatus]